MKLIRIFISFVVISVIVGVGSAFNGNGTDDFMVENQNEDEISEVYPQEKIEINDLETKTVEDKQETSNDIVENEIETLQISEVEVKQELSTETKEDKKQEKVVQDVAVKKEESKEVEKTSLTQPEVKKEEVIKSVVDEPEVKEVEKKEENITKDEEQQPIAKSEEIIEVKKEVAIWEELGISEYEYYNSPMWKWATVDFSIKDYGTEEKTRNACVAKGEELLEEGLGFSCSSINSYSGDYLGEMLETF